MKNKISKKTICLAAAAVIMVAGLSVGKTLAYFTAYTEASGGVVLDLGFTETIPEEKVVGGAKQLKIKNTGDFDCYVRVKALTGSDYTVTYSEPDNAGKWIPGEDDFYYYQDVLPAKTGITTQLDVNIAFPSTKEGEAPEFNVIVIQECTPVLYDENGAPYYDWSKTADVIVPAQPEEGGIE